jgi:hypothetical protein
LHTRCLVPINYGIEYKEEKDDSYLLDDSLECYINGTLIIILIVKRQQISFNQEQSHEQRSDNSNTRLTNMQTPELHNSSNKEKGYTIS